MILGPLAPWAPGGRTCCPSPRAGPVGHPHWNKNSMLIIKFPPYKLES